MRLGKYGATLGVVLLLAPASCSSGDDDASVSPSHSSKPVASAPAPVRSSSPAKPGAKKKPSLSPYTPQYCGVKSHAKDKGPSSVLLTIDDFPYQNGDIMIEVADWAKRTNTMMAAFPIAHEVNAYNRQHHTDLVAQVRTRGTYVGNHTYSHANLTEVSGAEARRQIKKGVSSNYLRPPYGAYGPAVRQLIEKNDARVCHWTIDTLDWQKVGGKYPPADVLVRRVRAKLKKVKRGTPVVILGHYQTNYPAALPAIRALMAQPNLRLCPAAQAPTTAGIPYPLC